MSELAPSYPNEESQNEFHELPQEKQEAIIQQASEVAEIINTLKDIEIGREKKTEEGEGESAALINEYSRDYFNAKEFVADILVNHNAFPKSPFLRFPPETELLSSVCQSEKMKILFGIEEEEAMSMLSSIEKVISNSKEAFRIEKHITDARNAENQIQRKDREFDEMLEKYKQISLDFEKFKEEPALKKIEEKIKLVANRKFLNSIDSVSSGPRHVEGELDGVNFLDLNVGEDTEEWFKPVVLSTIEDAWDAYNSDQLEFPSQGGISLTLRALRGHLDDLPLPLMNNVTISDNLNCYFDGRDFSCTNAQSSRIQANLKTGHVMYEHNTKADIYGEDYDTYETGFEVPREIMKRYHNVIVQKLVSSIISGNIPEEMNK